MAGIGLVYYKTIPIKNNNKLILGLDLIRFYEFINEETSFRVDDEEQTGISSSLSIGLNFEMKKIKIAPIISGDFVYRDQLGYSPYRRSVDVKFGVLMEL
jgi:small ligand-binding sensory domain FIST